MPGTATRLLRALGKSALETLEKTTSLDLAKLSWTVHCCLYQPHLSRRRIRLLMYAHLYWTVYCYLYQPCLDTASVY